MKIKSLLAFSLLAVVAISSQAADVYAGAGFPGAVLGYSAALPGTHNVSLRVEYAGGINYARTGTKNGTDYSGSFRSSRVGGFVDFFPFSNGFRVTGGLTENDTKATLNGKGGPTSTINGKTANLTGETYNVTLKYPSTTPFIGIGWGHQPDAQRGLGFFADLGVQFGRFRTDVQSSVVGKYGITQADVDAEAATVRDSVNRYSVLPSLMMGASFKF